MERELILVRYGEVFLKGLNRPYFMRALVKNIKKAVARDHADVWLHDGRILIAGFSDLEACAERASRVFGVHSVCPALEMEKDNFDAIADRAAEMCKGLRGTFKVVARRRKNK